MASSKVPSDRSTTYTGNLIGSLFETVSKAEQKSFADDDDEIMLERRIRAGHLRIDEVLDRVEQRRAEDSELISPVSNVVVG
jgi:hypothetical protein